MARSSGIGGLTALVGIIAAIVVGSTWLEVQAINHILGARYLPAIHSSGDLFHWIVRYALGSTIVDRILGLAIVVVLIAGAAVIMTILQVRRIVLRHRGPSITSLRH